MCTAQFAVPFKILWVHDSVVWCTLRSLTPPCYAHCRVWLHGMLYTAERDSAVVSKPQSFLKLWISQQNCNRIRKYFSLFIMGLDGFESWKNGGQKSRDLLPLRNEKAKKKRKCQKILKISFPYFLWCMRIAEPIKVYEILKINKMKIAKK